MLLFYKPYNVLSKFTDNLGQMTLKNFIDVPGVYAAGRLDKDSEGLLILSNDGYIIHQITHPKNKISKKYFAQVEGIPAEGDLNPFREGIEIRDYKTLPAKVKIVNDPGLPPRQVPVRNYHPTTWLEIIIQEGKNRQVRRMTAALGFPTLRLIRYAIGPLSLKGLLPGQWRWVTPHEIQQLR